MGKRRNKDHF